jgi:hypothetical protein
VGSFLCIRDRRRAAAGVLAPRAAIAIAVAGAWLTPLATVTLLAAVVVAELVVELVAVGAPRHAEGI